MSVVSGHQLTGRWTWQMAPTRDKGRRMPAPVCVCVCVCVRVYVKNKIHYVRKRSAESKPPGRCNTHRWRIEMLAHELQAGVLQWRTRVTHTHSLTSIATSACVCVCVCVCSRQPPMKPTERSVMTGKVVSRDAKHKWQRSPTSVSSSGNPSNKNRPAYKSTTTWPWQRRETSGYSTTTCHNDHLLQLTVWWFSWQAQSTPLSAQLDSTILQLHGTKTQPWQWHYLTTISSYFIFQLTKREY